MATKTAKKSINATAAEYQQLDRQIKVLEAKMKPLKKELLDYAKQNKELFDEAFQLKFPNGTYVSLRVTDVLEADDRAKELLVNNLGEQYIEQKLRDKLIIEDARLNKLLQKQITQAGASITQKEIYAVYAS